MSNIARLFQAFVAPAIFFSATALRCSLIRNRRLCDPLSLISASYSKSPPGS